MHRIASHRVIFDNPLYKIRPTAVCPHRTTNIGQTNRPTTNLLCTSSCARRSTSSYSCSMAAYVFSRVAYCAFLLGAGTIFLKKLPNLARQSPLLSAPLPAPASLPTLASCPCITACMSASIVRSVSVRSRMPTSLPAWLALTLPLPLAPPPPPLPPALPVDVARALAVVAGIAVVCGEVERPPTAVAAVVTLLSLSSSSSSSSSSPIESVVAMGRSPTQYVPEKG